MVVYEKYKDSGIYYIPRIPEGWHVMKGKYLFNEEDRPVRPEDDIVTCFRDGQVTLRKNRRTEGFTNAIQEAGYQGIRKGDLVIHNMDAFAGAIGVSDSDGKSTPVYAVCTPKSPNINQYYYCYLLRALAHNGFILSLARGIRERSTDFRFKDFKELYLPIPSPKEQVEIVRYIDSKTSEIDSAIAQQRKMIDLLNERKRIIIQDAVSLDTHSNWDSMRLRHICEFRNGYTPSKDIPAFWENGTIPWYRMDDIRDSGRKLKESKQYVTELAVKGGGLFEAGSFILATTATIGEHALLIADSLANQQFTNLKIRKSLKNKLTIEFFYYYLFLIDDLCKGMSNSSTFPAVDMNRLKNILVALPSLKDQESIVEFLDKTLSDIDKHIERTENFIAALQERKQIIINEAVTGKIKVS